MNVKRQITPTITIGDQPTDADLQALKAEGYGGVINLRNDGEPEQPLSTSAEGDVARGAGLAYLHYGVGAALLTEEGVNQVREFLDRETQSGKVLVHCRRGGRAVALVLIHQAKAQGWKNDEVFEKGKAMGLEVEGGLRTAVANYLQQEASKS